MRGGFSNQHNIQNTVFGWWQSGLSSYPLKTFRTFQQRRSGRGRKEDHAVPDLQWKWSKVFIFTNKRFIPVQRKETTSAWKKPKQDNSFANLSLPKRWAKNFEHKPAFRDAPVYTIATIFNQNKIKVSCRRDYLQIICPQPRLQKSSNELFFLFMIKFDQIWFTITENENNPNRFSEALQDH